MTQEEKAKAYDEALEQAKVHINSKGIGDTVDLCKHLFPELAESNDERIRKGLIEALKTSKTVGELKFVLPEPTREECIDYLEKQKINTEGDFGRGYDCGYEACLNSHGAEWLEKQKHPNGCFTCDEYNKGYESGRLNGFTAGYNKAMKEVERKEQKPIKMEVYEVGKGTTICGQDYKCKKDYKEGSCWYIKDVIYHCGRDGYLTDQNGVSWSCTPEWFNEYIQSNTEWAEEEKTRFVSGQFLQCKLSFDEFKEGEHYWLEYVGDDMYVGRSDNILNQKFHITPRQLYTLFSQQLEEKQEEQKPWKVGANAYFTPEQKPAEKQDYSGLNDLERAIHRGFLAAGVENVSVTIIKETAQECLSQMKPAEWSEVELEFRGEKVKVKRPFYRDDNGRGYSTTEQDDEVTWNALRAWAESHGHTPFELYPREEWSEEDEDMLNSCISSIEEAKENRYAYKETDGDTSYDHEIAWFKSLRPSPSWKPTEEQMKCLLNAEGLLRTDKRLAMAQKLAELYEQLKKLM